MELRGGTLQPHVLHAGADMLAPVFPCSMRQPAHCIHSHKRAQMRVMAQKRHAPAWTFANPNRNITVIDLEDSLTADSESTEGQSCHAANIRGSLRKFWFDPSCHTPLLDAPLGVDPSAEKTLVTESYIAWVPASKVEVFAVLPAPVQ